MLTVRIPDDLRDAIDAVRGDVPRERWIRRALESVLEPKGDGITDDTAAIRIGGTIRAGHRMPERSGS